MENNCRSPKEITEGYLSAGIQKTHKTSITLIILGILAGMFVGIGASSSMVASHGVENYGLMKLVAGLVFPVGLMLIMLVGGELFTGDCMIVFGVWDKKYTYMRMWKKLAIIWASNFIGALIIVIIVYYSGQLDMSYGGLGAFVLKTASGKVSLSWVQAFVSGIGCNIIVCAAMLMAYGATDVTGKIFAAFFSIMAFVVTGFEHCIANMYYICVGILATGNEKYVEYAVEELHLSTEQIASINVGGLFNNLIPVTLGNIVGGIVFIALPMYILNIRNEKIKSEKQLAEDSAK